MHGPEAFRPNTISIFATWTAFDGRFSYPVHAQGTGPQLLGRYFTYATSLLAAMSASTPLFDTIEADDPAYEQRTSATGNINTTANQASTNARPPQQMATNLNDAESGMFCHNSELGSV